MITHRDGRSEFCKKLGVPTLASVPEHGVWGGMLHRCRNPNRKDYAHYGGRGIRVCIRWHTFEHFYTDMGSRPSPKHTIDRKDNNGNYEPENCQWVLPRAQANNRRSNRPVSYHGTQMTLRNAIRAAGDVVTKWTVRLRLERGWPVERAVELPPIEKFQKRQS